MPFIPQHINAIVLFGEKTCNHLADILNYWQTILHDHAWDRYLFLCVTEEEWRFPGTGKLTPAAQELVNRQIIRCMPLRIRANEPVTWRMPRAFLNALQERLNMGKVMVHCICDDLSCAPPEEAAVSLVSSASDFLVRGAVTPLYYLMLREHKEARMAQREMAGSILQQKGSSIVYLLSRTANDGSRLKKETLWRALMCEILVNSAGKRAYIAPFVYTVGYTSLNANDMELYSMRCHEVAGLLKDHYNQPITNEEAWDILTLKNARQPMALNAYSIQAAVDEWVDRLADQFVIRPTETQMQNLRILSGASTARDTGILQDAARRLFEVNQRQTATGRLRQAAANHGIRVQAELRKYINLRGFPQGFLKSILDELAVIRDRKVTIQFAPLPERRLLQRMEEYLQYCCSVSVSCVRRAYVQQTASFVARYLIEAFEKIQGLLEKSRRIDQLTDLLPPYQLLTADELHLKEKYPLYAQAVRSTVEDGAMSLFGQGWITSAGDVYGEDFSLLPDAIHALMKSGELTLQEHLPGGFGSSFMEVLHNEFPEEYQMSHFLNQYLDNNRHMFFCPLDTPVKMGDVHFVDDQLQHTPWVKEHADNSMIVDNDNIEKLTFVHIQKDLKWLMDEWTVDNRFFGSHEDPYDAGQDGGWLSGFQQMEATSKPEEIPEYTAPESNAVTNPRNIRITEVNDRFILSWDWESGMPCTLISINGEMPIPCSQADYVLNNNGFDVTQRIAYGKNEIHLAYLSHASYGSASVCGKKYQVRYRISPSLKKGQQLRLGGQAPPSTALLLCEGKESDAVFYYPVALRGVNGAVSYDGLTLFGACELTTPRDEEFPMVQPIQDLTI